MLRWFFSQDSALSTQNYSQIPGGLAGGVTPVPIPNTEVKPSKADDTAAARQWDSRTLPGYKKPVEFRLNRLFFLSPVRRPQKAEGVYPAISITIWL